MGVQDPLILCVGPRRLRVNPVYSQHTRGGGKGANNVHKFERYLRHGDTHVATTYGPIIFGSQPCMLLKETGDPQGMHFQHSVARLANSRMQLQSWWQWAAS
jgi:pre-rRNA-processing protein TSR1